MTEKALPIDQIIELHRSVRDGAFPTNLLSQITGSDAGIPESEVLDFKVDVPATDGEYAKAVRDAVAFHNSYGGFIVFGVGELEKDRTFAIVGTTGALDLQKFRDLCRSYTGADVRISVKRESLQGRQVDVLSVCKRQLGEPPVRFQKNGPEAKPGKLLFKKDEVVFRQIGNNTVASQPADYDFLFSPRKPPSLDVSAAEGDDSSEAISHNLPDRALICSKFVGRGASLGDLWTWIADDFSRVRLIAGEGGLGKTSLAYRFCEELVKRRVRPYSMVLWLSAKKRQFVAATDSYREASHVDYDSAESLYRAICLELGCLEADVNGLEPRDLMRLALGTCTTVPAFVVVDDVDSLTPDEQRSVLEFGLRAPPTLKLILTTRVNFSYAEENVLKLDGLQGDEYVAYVSVLRERYGLPPATDKQIPRLQEVTRGSPLFTDSLLRLERRGLSLEAAITQWKGEKGMEVRKAALLREVQQLSKESKRVLYVVSILKNVSYTELAQIVGYAEQTLGDALQELASLFLIGAPAIAKEARFTVEPNTGALVLEIASTLNIDHTALLQASKRERSDAVGLSITKRNDLVGQAIAQAIAKLKVGDAKSALDGVLDASKKLTRPNADLLLMIGRCHLKQSPPNFSEASKKFDEAFGLGQRKLLLFDLWFQAEYGRHDLDGCLTLIDIALDQPGVEQSGWYERRAQIRVERAQSRRKGTAPEAVQRELEQAVDDLKAAMRNAPPTERTRFERLISQARAVQSRLLKREATLSIAGLKVLDDIAALCEKSNFEPDVAAEYFEAVELVTSSALLKFVGKPRGEEREKLDRHHRNARTVGAGLIANAITFRARNTYRSLESVIDQYQLRRDI